ncbi:MAG TPA: hypothetical protein VIH22_07195 [Cyclobacteriaceae bacterium]
MAAQEVSREFGGYSILVNRMTKLIDALEPHQRDYHVVLQVDIYWYIQKRKEVEVLVNRLTGSHCDKLEHYLHSICGEITRRIDRDERFANEHLRIPINRMSPKDDNYGRAHERRAK